MNNNYNLTYPKETDYYDINVFNTNFSNLADAIDNSRSGGGSGSGGEVIVAAHNSKSPLRSSADYTCTQEDCSDTIQQAVTAAGEGGTVLLLDGDFYVKSTIEITTTVRFKGLGMYNTILNVDNIFSAIHLDAANSYIEDIGFHCGDGTNRNTIAIEIAESFIVVENCHFRMNYSSKSDSVAAIYIASNGYNVIRNCFFEQPEGRYMVNSPEYNMRGLIYGNYAEELNSDKSISIKINLRDRTSYDSMSFGAQKSEIYISTSPVQ